MKKIKIANYLHLENIFFLNVDSREEAIFSLIESLKLNHPLDKKAFYQAVIARENIVSTGIGMGVAVPHAKLAKIPGFFIVLGVQQNAGIDWDSIDKSLVRLVFLIGGPQEKKEEYLQILSRLTSIIKDENLRKKFAKSSSRQEIFQLLMQY